MALCAVKIGEYMRFLFSFYSALSALVVSSFITSLSLTGASTQAVEPPPTQSPTDWQAELAKSVWSWDARLTTPFACAYPVGGFASWRKYDVHLLCHPMADVDVEVWRDNRRLYGWQGHSKSVFGIEGTRLYYADFDPCSCGGRIVCVDLDTGRVLWSSKLRAIGDRVHSVYANEMNFYIGRGVVVVYGKESAGRYIEMKSTIDGETVAHRVFEQSDADGR
jgi:hypothetical protein